MVVSFEMAQEIPCGQVPIEDYREPCGAVQVMLYRQVPTFESIDKILNCNQSNESYWVVLSWGVVQSGSNV